MIKRTFNRSTLWRRQAALATAGAFLLAVTATAFPVGQAAAADLNTSGTLLFEDDFNGYANTSPDQSKWTDYSACSYNGSAAYGNIQCGDNEKLDGNGNLKIPATPTAGSAIRTGDNFTFKYGTVSAWIKNPSQPGYWPAFWTLNSNADGSEDLPVGEVDVMEGYTTWDDVYHAVGHNWTGDEATTYHSNDNRCAEGQNVSLSGGFNKYSAKIEADKVTYYFNDVQCGTAFKPSSDPTKAWAFGDDISRENWLILNLAVGGAGGQQTPASEAAEILVDRVEVRANDAEAAPVTSGQNYRIINHCEGKTLEVPAFTTVDGAALGVWSQNGGSNQKWKMVDVGNNYFKMLSVANNKAVNVAYSSQDDGMTVIQWPDFGGSNQEWKLVSTGDEDVYRIVSRNSGKALTVNGNNVHQWTVDTASCAQKWQVVR